MNRILTVALAATAFVATPALAQEATPASFSGPRVGAHIGGAGTSMFNFGGFAYGAEVGYDFQTGGAVLGITAEIQDVADADRDLSLTGRVGGVVGNKVLLYGLAGYTNVKAYGLSVDGFRLGLGAEMAVGSKGFVKVEQRYSNYQYDLDLHQSLIGAGIRF